MNNRIARLVAAGVLTVLLGAGGGARAAETIKMTVTAGHPPVFLWVQLLKDFVLPEIDKRLAAAGGDYEIEWTEAYGGTIAKIGGELDAIRDGLSDMGFVGTIFHAPQMPLQNVSYFAPFGTDSIADVTETISEMQRDIPAMGSAWTRNNQIFLGGAALDTYHLFTNFPVNSIDDLTGKKIMAPGPSANWINGTGAVAVASSLPEYYNNIKTGVADGVVTFATGAFPIKLWEVAPYLTKVNFGAQFAGGISINRDRYAEFPPEVRQIFRDVGKEFADRFAMAQAGRVATFTTKMVEAGLKVSELSPEERKRWALAIPNAAKGWAKRLDEQGLPGTTALAAFMEGIQKKGADVPRDWSKE